MGIFNEKLDQVKAEFSNALKKFDEVTALPVLEVLAGRLCQAEEFIKASRNIKVAS